MGPVDIVVIGYPAGAPMTGEAIPILLDLVDRGVVRVLDVRGILREDDGFTAFDAGRRRRIPVLAHFEGAQTGLIGDADLAAGSRSDGARIGRRDDRLREQWAAPFANAVLRNGGRMIAYERVVPRTCWRRSRPSRPDRRRDRKEIRCHF